MQVSMTRPMIEALKSTPEIPDNLMRCVTAAKGDGGGYSVEMNEDEAMAMTEMCQWYIKKDPATGTFGPKAEVFDAIVRAIYKAQDA
ncbi:MAG: hypothetical protein HY700_14695 [Gemmatimonadetes bacterium]|nr:hypothetical protein [Gemmatimonadota bacterium]